MCLWSPVITTFQATINIPNLAVVDGKGFTYKYVLSQKDLDQVCADYIKQVLQLADRALRSLPNGYEMEWRNLQLILAGGTSRIKSVSKAIFEWTKMRILEADPSLDESTFVLKVGCLLIMFN